jgi:hypothetical protein
MDKQSNVFFKIINITSNELPVQPYNNDTNTIILITTNKDSLSTLSTLSHEIYAKNINTFLNNIKACAVRGSKYTYCKINHNDYKLDKEEFFIRILNPFEVNYNKFIRYIELSTDPNLRRNKYKKEETKKEKNIDKSRYSIYTGVKLPTPTQFTANINKDGTRYYLGCYNKEILAAYAYNCMAIELYGINYRKLNIIDKPEGYEWVSVIRRVLPIK